MATLFQKAATESSTNQSVTDFEPDEQWKSRFKVDIESNLRSMVDKAKQNLQDTLKRAPVSAVERERLTEEHLVTMKKIRNLAEEQFRITLERERQERRWAAGQVLDQDWSDNMIQEQQAVLDKIEREHKDIAAHSSSSSSSQPIADPSISRSSRSPERVWTSYEHTESEHEADYFSRLLNRKLEDDNVSPLDTSEGRAGSVSASVGLYKPPSALETKYFERPKPSPTNNELNNMPRSARPAANAQDNIRRGSPLSKASISIRQLPEFWHPSITPEQDFQMSRTFSIARRGSIGTTSSYRAPSVLNIPFSTEPHDILPTSAMERESARISAIDRERTTSYTYAETQAGITTTPQCLDERYPPPLSSVAPSVIPYPRPVESPSSTVPIAYSRPTDSPGYTRSSDNARPPPSASRPIATKKSLTFDDSGFQSSPSPKGWYDTSRSPQTPEEVPRGWQSSNLRARRSSQDMRYGYYASRPAVHTHHEVSEGYDGAKWWEYDERQMRQREDSVSLRGREEEVARREQELRRREEEARREEAKLKEEELEGKEEETKRKEDEIRHKEMEARRGQEEADRKELEIRREEVKKKEDEIQRKENLAKKKMEEGRRQEGQVRNRAEDLRKQEEELRLEEVKRAPLEISQKTKRDDARVKEEVARAKFKEEEIRRKKVQQDEFRKREEEIRRQRAEEKKRQESWGHYPPETSRPTPPPKMATSRSQIFLFSTKPWSILNRSDHSMPRPSPPIDRSGSSTTSTRPSSAASSQVSKPPTLSVQQNAEASPGPSPAPFSEAEFYRRQAEQVQQREEQFRREQAKLEQERLSKAVKAKLDKQNAGAVKLFEHHRGQWAKLQISRVLIWDNFPWPVFKRSSGPDDITTPDITAYMLSSLHPIDKSLRHRVKENIRRWHHDRFEIWLLPKVKEGDRDSVREAASTVARTLHHLLRSGMQDLDVSTANSRIMILKPPILLAQQNINAPSHPAHTPISEAKVHRSEVGQARQSEERFRLEPVKLGQEEQLAQEKECSNLKPHTELFPNISTSSSPETTATVEEAASPELPGSVSDSPQDLTNELQRRSSFPAASGGFGDIWKCILVKTNGNVDVAVKTIRAFETDNEELVRKNARRVRRELKVWGRLKHHSILPLWGVANDFGPYPAMICPWANNGALTGYLERQQDMSSHDRFSLLNDIALGLQYLHSKSVVHGDLTGSNVLISGNGRACLADFGLSTIILEFVGTSYFTSSIRGNVRWVAAELCEISEDDELELSTECDIYSFGSITLQVLTCKVPYYNVKKDIAVLGQVIKGIKPKPPKESQIVPGHWEFIQRCWLPRASRPSMAEIVMFIACERQAVSS